MGRFARVGFSLLAMSVLLLATAGTSAAREAGTTYLKVKGVHGGKPGGGGSHQLKRSARWDLERHQPGAVKPNGEANRR